MVSPVCLPKDDSNGASAERNNIARKAKCLGWEDALADSYHRRLPVMNSANILGQQSPEEGGTP